MNDFWQRHLQTNAQTAIFHQWEQLEKTGCIDNFRLVNGEVEGFREGWFFADSDAYKWLDAAARIYASSLNPHLKTLMDDFIALLERAQMPDGYLYTYNQLHFPEVRWQNLQIEHELYCHGHLIEAAVSHFQATDERHALDIAISAADLLVRDFRGKGPKATPGHQEIEIALIRLYEVTGAQAYLALAQQFLEQRGRLRFAFIEGIKQLRAVARRTTRRDELRAAYAREHPGYAQSRLPPGNAAPAPPLMGLRFNLSALSGKYNQQHQPIHRQTVPVGHAVRYAYQQTATAMLARHTGDLTLLGALERSWERMVARRMYVTGGIGALSHIEGFGRDYELDPMYAYAETCAALGGLFWNWQMTLLTRQAKYADLFEWQLYNASAVGMGDTGDTYLYNNPLTCTGEVTRQAWYAVPCCPSNISRAWADLPKYLYSIEENDLWVHQYISGAATPHPEIGFDMTSGLPYDGRNTLQLDLAAPKTFTLHLRIPSWVAGFEISINGTPFKPLPVPPRPMLRTACGYSPATSYYLPITRQWQPGDTVQVVFPLELALRRTHPRVKPTRGMVALTRGPLVYCLESVDNPALDVINATLDPATLTIERAPDLFGGITVLRGKTSSGAPFTAIPYYLWANRGSSQMSVYLKV